MKRILQLVFISFIFLSCSLKGKIVEHIDFKMDGSGVYSITLDLKPFRRVLKSVDHLDKNSQNAQIFLYNAFIECSEKISKVYGISNTALTYDTNMLEFTIAFDFKNLKALNIALCIINKLRDHSVAITWEGEKFVRTVNSAESFFRKSIEEDGEFETIKGFKFFLKNIKFIMTYTFEGSKVRSPTFGYSSLSDDMSAITYEYFFVDMNDEFNQVIFLSSS